MQSWFYKLNFPTASILHSLSLFLSDTQLNSYSIQQQTFPKGVEFVEVFVSAIANPDHFWIQVITSMALELDRLSESMTHFYNGPGKVLVDYCYY